jgi:putative hydrolase of the HAD superfamily
MKQNEQIKKVLPITTLFVDISGVFLTNGWDHHARKRAEKAFDLDLNEMEDQYHLTFDTYEVGKLIFEEYLSRVVFTPVLLRVTMKGEK